MTAATVAYQRGAARLDELLDYPAENRCWFKQALADAAPSCTMTQLKEPISLGLDCRSLGLNDADLQQALVAVAKLAPSMGSGFGPQGSGFIRINPGARAGISSVAGLARLK